ncbi:MAG: ornithine carbamoyltransferase [Coriobacteriia bacterium]|nr:ornithine carbamoyltransferase [Coriobacteriia bacterium]
MPSPLAGRDLLRLFDLTVDELRLVLDTAHADKARWQSDFQAALAEAPCAGRAVAVILEKPSLRTRVSFEAGIVRLGAHPAIMGGSDSAFSRGESIKDTVMVLERYVAAIVIRTFAQAKANEIAHWAKVPVVNALTDDFHPCQGLADLMTIEEELGDLAKLKLAYVGDGSNNMTHTYLEGCALTGMGLSIASPPEYRPKPQYLNEALAQAAKTGAQIEFVESPEQAVEGADVVITDTWTSMGEEEQQDLRAARFEPYRVTGELMAKANPSAVFMHCLPAHRGAEVTDEVMDAPYSKIYNEAENRLHVQQALLKLLLC